MDVNMLECGDVITLPGPVSYRSWEVTAICLGGLDEESFVCLRPLDRTSHRTLRVPVDLLRGVSNARLASTGELGQGTLSRDEHDPVTGLPPETAAGREADRSIMREFARRRH